MNEEEKNSRQREADEKEASALSAIHGGRLHRIVQGLRRDRWWRRSGFKTKAEVAERVDAAEGYRRSADLGDADAQHALAILYLNGDCVPRSAVKAAHWLRKAADQGHPRAQLRLGLLYDEGAGVRGNPSLAISWYRRAAALGDSDANYLLGDLYEAGAKDLSKAVECYRKAAELGHPDAQYKLALAYDTGRGIPVDLRQAQVWYERAAKQGSAESRIRLGWDNSAYPAQQVDC